MVTDSCFCCITMLINPPTPHCYRYDRPRHDWNELYSHTPDKMSIHGRGVPKAFRALQGPPAGSKEADVWDDVCSKTPVDISVRVRIASRPGKIPVLTSALADDRRWDLAPKADCE